MNDCDQAGDCCPVKQIKINEKKFITFPTLMRGSVFIVVQKPNWVGACYQSFMHKKWGFKLIVMCFVMSNDWHDFKCHLEWWQDMGNLKCRLIFFFIKMIVKCQYRFYIVYLLGPTRIRHLNKFIWNKNLEHIW